FGDLWRGSYKSRKPFPLAGATGKGFFVSSLAQMLRIWRAAKRKVVSPASRSGEKITFGDLWLGSYKSRKPFPLAARPGRAFLFLRLLKCCAFGALRNGKLFRPLHDRERRLP